MAIVTFNTTGNSNDPANNRVAVNSDQVVLVTPVNHQSVIHVALPRGDGYVAYTLAHAFDDVVAQLGG